MMENDVVVMVMVIFVFFRKEKESSYKIQVSKTKFVNALNDVCIGIVYDFHFAVTQVAHCHNGFFCILTESFFYLYWKFFDQVILMLLKPRLVN